RGLLAALESIWVDDEGNERLGASRRAVELVDEGGGWFHAAIAPDNVVSCRRVLALTGGDARPLLRATAEIPESTASVVNVGPVAATTPPLICAGVVLDSAENPLDRCQIQCEPQGEIAWSDRTRYGEQVPVLSRDDGAFELRKHTGARRFAITVNHP